MSDRNYSYELSLNILKALGGDMTVQYENADQIWAAIDEIYAATGDGIDLQELALEITENGTYDYNRTDKIDAYVPVNIKVNVHQKYTDEQVEALKEESRQQGYIQGESEGYSDGYAEGLDDGAEEQKGLLEELNVTKNGIYEKEDGYNKVNVEVPDPELQELMVSLPANGNYRYEPTKYGYSVVNITVDVENSGGGTFETEELNVEIKENGTYNYAPTTDGFSDVSITVDVPTGGGGSVFDFSVLGFGSDVNNMLNNGIQADIDYSKSIKDNWNPNVTSLSKKFQYDKIKYMPNVDTSKVTSMSYMFNGSSIIYIDLFDTSKVTNMSYMFDGCSILTSVPLFDTSNVTNMSHMFDGCVNLTSVPLFDTSNVTSMSYMLSGCVNLTSVPLFDTSKVIEMNYMFYNTQLKSVPAFNTSKVTNFSRCFEILGNKLTSFPVLDCSSCTNITYFFGISNPNFTNLTDLGGFINLGCKSSLSGTTDSYFLKKVPNLTHESIMNVINNLYDRASAGYSIMKLAMHANHLALLTDEEKAIATNKGWTLA